MTGAATTVGGAPRSAASRVGRDGSLRLGFERRGGATALSGCRWTVPLQVLAPVALDDPAAVVSILNPTGGLVGGDRLQIEVTVGPGAHACVTTPSATKVYRTAGEAAEQEVRLRLEAGAALEWVPDHTIPFAGAALRQRIDVELGPAARLVLVDAFAAGRVARGEAWRFRHLESAIRVRDGRGWLFCDRFVLGAAGGPADSGAGLGMADGYPYVATVLVAGGADWTSRTAVIQAALGGRSGIRGGAGPLARGGLLVRLLAADAPGLAEALGAVWGLARQMLLGAPPLVLRKP